MVNFAGLDLSAKESNPSGLAVINSFKEIIDLTVVFSDIEIASRKNLYKPIIIAIDAPLTFSGKPFRQVDRSLLKACFRALPITLTYMCELAERAQVLKKILESRNVAVIETHPTSALKSSRCSSHINLFQSFGFKQVTPTLRNKQLIDALISSIVSYHYYHGTSVIFKEADGEVHLLPTLC